MPVAECGRWWYHEIVENPVCLFLFFFFYVSVIVLYIIERNCVDYTDWCVDRGGSSSSSTSSSMKSTSELRQDATNYKFTPTTPLKIYLQVCVSILDRAQLAFQKDNFSDAYLYYYRYVDLCTNKLAMHAQCLMNVSTTDAEQSLYRQEYLQLIKLEVPAVLKILEELQQHIDKKYESHQLSLARNIATASKNTLLDNKQTAQKKLPSSFDEGTFNQSIAYYHETIPTQTAHKTGKELATPLLYPKLPQLSPPIPNT